MSDVSSYGFGFDKGSAIALGTFDGVHSGHMQVLKKTVKEGGQLNTVALTFSAPPKKAKLLYSLAKKEQLILKSGIKQVFTLDFDFVKDLSPVEFFENILLDSFNAKIIVCGFNYRFGKGALGDVTLLKTLCEQNNIRLFVCEEYKSEIGTVSSTNIRNLINEGNFEVANDLLGRYFELGETVTKGKNVGSKLGFATANFTVSDSFIVPRQSVYATYTRIGDKIFPSVTNFGGQPTFNGEKNICETHILGFNEDIYGTFIEVGFIKRLRDTKKFDSFQLLSQQITVDKQNAMVIFEQNREKILKSTLQI